MDENKGMSVKEIEEFAKKHRYEVFFCLLFLLACIFGLFGYFKPDWNVLFGMGGGILGVIFPAKIESFSKKVFKFAFKQDKTVLLLLGVVGLIFAIFIPFIVFLFVGLFGGRTLHQMAIDSSSK